MLKDNYFVVEVHGFVHFDTVKDGCTIFNESDITDENSSSYTMFLRYQMSDAEAEEIINSGGMPQANILVTAVYINKQNGGVSDDLGNDVWVLE